jgi:hypothetical protein
MMFEMIALVNTFVWETGDSLTTQVYANNRRCLSPVVAADLLSFEIAAVRTLRRLDSLESKL